MIQQLYNSAYQTRLYPIDICQGLGSREHYYLGTPEEWGALALMWIWRNS